MLHADRKYSHLHVHMLFLVLLLAMVINVNGDISMGVNYGQIANNLPQPALVASILQSMKINRVRLLDTDPDILRAFSYTGISLIINVPNGFIPRMASNQSEALRWLNRYVKPFFPRTRISTISVGNEVLSVSPELAEFLLPAMQNMFLGLRELGLQSSISVSTTHSLDILATAFPPSAGEFQDSIADTVMKPILDFLVSINGSFLVNVYPYLVYKSEPTIPLGYALFEEEPLSYRDDPSTGLRYKNLFDCLVDAVISAMSSLGYEYVPVVVTETGWPSLGDPNEQEATLENAAMYNRRLVNHVLSSTSRGTPLRRQGSVETYIFGLFDENMRDGPISEQHWGILHPNMTRKYPLDFSAGSHFYRSYLLIFIAVLFTLVML